MNEQAKLVVGDRYFRPSSLYATHWNAAKPHHMRKDAATGKLYFPDIKLKNTALGEALHHPSMTAFIPFLKYDDMHPFSMLQAAEGQFACLVQT